ncbi:MAG TPA: DUF6105 family protein [Aurantimonas sp.]|jgi:hypothetical protein|nr:DUF6105 family protein [Aurantimonas sp.]
MRALFWLWFTPLAVFWSWYFLSLNDAGGVFFSRALHDHVFGIYGDMLGIDPAEIAPLIARALVVDTFILAGIVAFRRRRRIAEWWRQRRAAEPAA